MLKTRRENQHQECHTWHVLYLVKDTEENQKEGLSALCSSSHSVAPSPIVQSLQRTSKRWGEILDMWYQNAFLWRSKGCNLEGQGVWWLRLVLASVSELLCLLRQCWLLEVLQTAGTLDVPVVIKPMEAAPSYACGKFMQQPTVVPEGTSK